MLLKVSKLQSIIASMIFLMLAAVAQAQDAEKQVSLNGAGATFPYPLYSKWMSEFQKANPTIKMNYQSIGSGGGIKQITEQTVNFGASDGPMSDEQLKKVSGELFHIPATLGGVVPTYNLEDINQPIKFTGEVLANIYLGKIKKWNAPELKELNPDISLPNKDIAVVHRSDGSGTTYIWVDYLCKVSPEWKEKVGKGTSVKWPVGIGGKGNEGVTAQVKELPASIGYVELIYALGNKLPYGAVRNKEGKFIQASIESVTAAAAGAIKDMPDDFRVSITDASGEDVYPIASFTWLLVYKEQQNPKTGKALAKFLWWAIHEGQEYAPNLYYAKLPDLVIDKIENKLKKITCNEKPLLD